MEKEGEDQAGTSIMDDASEQNAKTTFFDDGKSIELKKDKKRDESISNKNEEIKNQVKLYNVNINNETESVMYINMRKRKIMNPDDDYYSVKIPKFINVCPNIRHISPREREIFTDVIGHADSSLDNESESIDIQMNKTSNHLAKGEKSIISWCFDEDTYKKIKNAKNGTCDEDPPNDNLMDILNKTVVKEWMKEKCIKGESRNEEEATGRKETILVDHTDDSDMSYLTDDDLSDFANVEEFYECYQVTKNCHDMMSAPNMDPNDKVNILCNNMKYMDTNSFIAEYEDGKLIFFINEKPYILEHDKETNYLIESTEMNMMPIHCKLEKKFFIKSITRDEQNISPPKNLKLKNTDIYYSLYPVKK